MVQYHAQPFVPFQALSQPHDLKVVFDQQSLIRVTLRSPVKMMRDPRKIWKWDAGVKFSPTYLEGSFLT